MSEQVCSVVLIVLNTKKKPIFVLFGIKRHGRKWLCSIPPRKIQVIRATLRGQRWTRRGCLHSPYFPLDHPILRPETCPRRTRWKWPRHLAKREKRCTF